MGAEHYFCVRQVDGHEFDGNSIISPTLKRTKHHVVYLIICQLPEFGTCPS